MAIIAWCACSLWKKGRLAKRITTFYFAVITFSRRTVLCRGGVSKTTMEAGEPPPKRRFILKSRKSLSDDFKLFSLFTTEGVDK